MTFLPGIRRRLARVQARRRELVGINRRNVELVYPLNARRDFPLADDKLLAKERMAAAGVPVAETLAVCDGLYSVPRTTSALENEEGFVIKPANGSGGVGILVVGERLEPGVWRRAGGDLLDRAGAQRHLADIVVGAYSNQLEDRAFVERRVDPHPFFRQLYADGLCDIRVITLRRAAVLSMVRVPTARSQGRANLHQGGLGLAVDLERGQTVRAFSRGQTILAHPETGMPLLGLQIPAWDRVLDTACRAAAAVPLGYLGIDIVVDAVRGPLVLEINARPGLEIQNVHGTGLGRALPEGFL